MERSAQPQVKTFFDINTSTLTYIVYDSQSLDAIVIDPVLDFELASGTISYDSAEKIKHFVETNRLKVHWVLETHAHADHLSSAQVLKKWWPQAKTGIARRITEVQSTFKELFNLTNDEFIPNGGDFDVLLSNNESCHAGRLQFRVIFTPGHTPACASYQIGNYLFTGDALFMPDSGTGRCDFPNASADTLFTSVHDVIFALPPQTQIMVGHDYQPNGRELRWESTIAQQMEQNIHINKSTTREQYVKFRTERDKTLSAPKLLLPSLQINIRGGKLPRPDAQGKIFLKIPLAVPSI